MFGAIDAVFAVRVRVVGGVGRKITNALVDVGVRRMIRLGKIAGGEQGLAHVLHVIFADRVGENRKKIFDADARRLHEVRIVERGVHQAGVDVAPAIAETVRVEAAHVKTLAATPLKSGGGIVVAFDKKIDRFAAELRRRNDQTESAAHRAGCDLLCG